MDLARKAQERELKQKAELEEEKQRLLIKKQEAERKYAIFKTEKMINSISRILKIATLRNFNQGFNTMVKYNIDLSTILLKVEFEFLVLKRLDSMHEELQAAI